MKKYRSWIGTIFLGFFIFVLIILAFNYFVDSFSLFNKLHNSNSRGSDLLNGYFITGKNISSNRVDNVYEVMIKESQEIDFLAIGSSRTIGLHKELLFGNKNIKYFNFTDGTASLKHYAKIIGLFNKYKKTLPKNIILGIDPWVFDKPVSMSQIQRLINCRANDNSRYLQLFNYEYTKLNFMSLFNKNNYQKSKTLSDLLIQSNDNMILSPYGDLYHSLKTHNIDYDTILQSIKDGLNKCDEENFNTKCIKYDSLNNFNELKYFIDYLREKKIKILVYLAPFEPTFYNHIVKNNNFLSHSRRIKEFFINNDIATIGSYNPYDYNLTIEYFLDGIHPKSSAIKIIFENKKVFQ